MPKPLHYAIDRLFPRAAVLLCALVVALSGCKWPAGQQRLATDPDLQHYKTVSTQIEYPDLETDTSLELSGTPPPMTLDESKPIDFWDMTLQEAIQLSLANSKVLRDLGGQVLQSPDSIPTIHSPALQETDPRYGVDAALSAFDASWSTQAFFEKNDRAVNNQFFGGGTRLLKQDLLAYNSEIFKRSAIGTQLTARHTVDYDFNNSPGNNIPNLPWATALEAEARQPIYFGGADAGVDFNRIAGPGATPGVYNGVLIARVNLDINLADFEAGVRNLVSEVENAYWSLYFAYRKLDATMGARDRALETWRRIHALAVTGRRGGEASKEAQSREQYFRLEADVQNALNGSYHERGRGGVLRNEDGVYTNERLLRLITGLPIGDGRLIRPSTEPTIAKVNFDWEEVVAEALVRREELRRQKWKIKQRELECKAARNFLYPQLDAVGRYRWRGLGHDLIEPNGTGRPPFNDAAQNLLDGNFQEWQLGFELAFPIGYRQAHAAVRNAELQLAREHALLREQERDVTLDVSNAIGEKDRAYLLAKTNFNRCVAGKQQLLALEAVYKDADENQKTRLLDLLLDAQRRLADAEQAYFRSIVEYMLAIKHVHFTKGSLLDYNEIALSESAWPDKAYEDSQARDNLRLKRWRLDNFVMQRPTTISRGWYPQNVQSNNDRTAAPSPPLEEEIPTPLP